MKSNVTIVNSLLALSRKIANFSAPLRQLVTPKHLAPVSLATILGLGGVTWVVESAIAPTVAQAYTARVDISLNSQQGESFDTFLNRAEVIARAAAQRLFDRDVLVTDVAVTILGQHEGQIAPILELEVNRQAWRRIPEAPRWATYFPNAQLLLNFQDTANTAASEAGGQPTTSPGAQTRPRPTRPRQPRTEIIRDVPSPEAEEGIAPETGIQDTDTVRDNIDPEDRDEIVEDELGTEEEQVVETEEQLENEQINEDRIDPDEDVLQNQDILDDENL